jgi:hypothetical protein
MNPLDITNYVKLGIVIAIVIIIQTVKKNMDKSRMKNVLSALPSWFWHIVSFGSGIIQAVIITGMDTQFLNFNVWTFIYTCLIYSAATSFIYQTYKSGKQALNGQK